MQSPAVAINNPAYDSMGDKQACTEMMQMQNADLLLHSLV